MCFFTFEALKYDETSNGQMVLHCCLQESRKFNDQVIEFNNFAVKYF